MIFFLKRALKRCNTGAVRSLVSKQMEIATGFGLGHHHGGNRCGQVVVAALLKKKERERESDGFAIGKKVSGHEQPLRSHIKTVLERWSKYPVL